MIKYENCWDVDLLANIFYDRDINIILSVSIREHDKDIWYWGKEKLGDYLVKIAYVLLQENKEISSTNIHCWKRL